MDAVWLLYPTGEEVHAGDRIQYRLRYGTVVFVSNGETEEFAPGYEDYRGTDRGIVIADDDGAIDTIGEPNDELSLVERA
jgi:hypothetical protein